MPQTSRHAISELVSRMLNHYPTRDELPAVRMALARDWVDDLEAFGVPIVEAACRDWRRDHADRPMIADIRRLCIEAQNAARDRLALADKTRRGLDADTVRDWERPEHEGDTRTWQQRRQDAITANAARYRRAEQWRRDNPHWLDRKPVVDRHFTRAGDLGVTVTETYGPPVPPPPTKPRTRVLEDI